MCGITALFAYRSSAPPIRAEELDAITASMRTRGPDAGGTWISPDGRVGLGSRRLAIIDLSDEGTQPMFDVERELVIAFNGEIYNHRELRVRLESSGARFHSSTDTEVLLQLYRRDVPASTARIDWYVVNGSGTLPITKKPAMPASSRTREIRPPARSAFTCEAMRIVAPSSA
jgi:asparagine synthase (glutamine-hydrolysing)